MGNDDAYRLTGTEALARIRSGDMTIEGYARSLLRRIDMRDAEIGAWAYLDKDYVLAQARALDKVPMNQRGPLHGLPLAVKDIIYTKGEWEGEWVTEWPTTFEYCQLWENKMAMLGAV